MTTSLTRCPNCGATFYIGQRQLEAAGGRARCGRCLRIFAAADHLLEPAEPAAVFVGHAPEEYRRPDSVANQAKQAGRAE